MSFASRADAEWTAAEKAFAEMEAELDAQPPGARQPTRSAAATAPAEPLLRGTLVAPRAECSGKAQATAVQQVELGIGEATGGSKVMDHTRAPEDLDGPQPKRLRTRAASTGAKKSPMPSAKTSKRPASTSAPAAENHSVDQRSTRPSSGKASKRTKSTGSASDAESGAISARRLKQYAGKNENESVPITVGLTGARAGDILNGCSDDTANVVLRIDTGAIAAPSIIRRSVEHEVGRDKVIAAVAKHFGIASIAAAEMRYEDCPVSEQPNHAPLGQGCSHNIGADGQSCGCQPAARFTILNQGVWQQFADEHGHGTRHTPTRARAT